MAARVDLSGVTRIERRMANLGNIGRGDVDLLLDQWETTLIEDNRKGVLAGTDKDDEPLVPTKYRSSSGGKATRARSMIRGFGTVDLAAWRGANQAVRDEGGKSSFLANGNLSREAYEKLGGTPLAPRGLGSRIVTHYDVDSFQSGPSTYEVVGEWLRILSVKGVPFMAAHFQGRNRLPKRDMAGLRRWGRNKVLSQLRAWVRGIADRKK